MVHKPLRVAISGLTRPIPITRNAPTAAPPGESK